MRFSTVAAVSLLTLAACMPADAEAQGGRYVARGTEPFWSLTIDARTMRFEAPDRATVTVPRPRVIHGFAGEIYQTRRIGVNTVHKPCSDGMSDLTYADTVTVTVDGRRYEGCGGATTQAPLPSPAPATLLEGEWKVRTIAGRPPLAGTDPRVTFEGLRISGATGCNRFSGNFRFERGHLTSGPLVSTKMGCPPPRGMQESRMLSLFGQRLSVSSNRMGRLVLSSRRGETIVLERDRRR